MFVIEYKIKAKQRQYGAIDEAIRTGQFVRNKALRYWMDNKSVNKYDLNKYCRILAKDYNFANNLNSTARQSSAVGEAFPKGTSLECNLVVSTTIVKKNIPP